MISFLLSHMHKGSHCPVCFRVLDTRAAGVHQHCVHNPASLRGLAPRHRVAAPAAERFHGVSVHCNHEQCFKGIHRTETCTAGCFVFCLFVVFNSQHNGCMPRFPELRQTGLEYVQSETTVEALAAAARNGTLVGSRGSEEMGTY